MPAHTPSRNLVGPQKRSTPAPSASLPATTTTLPTAGSPPPLLDKVAAGSGGCWTMRFSAGTNMPWSCGHEKYLVPSTEPSFLPTALGNSRPAHTPGRNLVVPMNRKVATPRASLPATTTRLPTAGCVVVAIERENAVYRADSRERQQQQEEGETSSEIDASPEKEIAKITTLTVAPAPTITLQRTATSIRGPRQTLTSRRRRR